MLFVNNAPHGIAFVAPLDAIKSLKENPRTVAVASTGFAGELWEQPPKYLEQVTEGTAESCNQIIVPGSPWNKRRFR